MVERENSELISHFSTDYWRRSLLPGAPGSRGRAIPKSHPPREGEAEVRSELGTCNMQLPRLWRPGTALFCGLGRPALAYLL